MSFWNRKKVTVSQTKDESRTTTTITTSIETIEDAIPPKAMTARSLHEELLQGYSSELSALEEESRRQQIVIDSLQQHLDRMKQIDVNLEQQIQAVWKTITPSVRRCLAQIAEILRRAPELIKESETKMSTAEESVKPTFAMYIQIVQQNTEHTKHAAYELFRIVQALEDATVEIGKHRQQKAVSDGKVRKLFQDYASAKETGEKILAQAEAVKAVQDTVRIELTQTIARMTSEIAGHVQNGVIAETRYLLPSAELLFESQTSIESLEKAGSTIGDMQYTWEMILEKLKKAHDEHRPQALETLSVDMPIDELEANITQTLNKHAPQAAVKALPAQPTPPPPTKNVFRGFDERGEFHDGWARGAQRQTMGVCQCRRGTSQGRRGHLQKLVRSGQRFSKRSSACASRR